MESLITIALIVVAYVALQYFILPKLGVPT